MSRWFAIAAAVAFLSIPALVSADETRIPPEANWTATPSTPELVAIPQPRVASAAPEQITSGGYAQPDRPFLALTDQDASYQEVNATAMDE